MDWKRHSDEIPNEKGFESYRNMHDRKDNGAASLFTEFSYLVESEFLNQFGNEDNGVSISLYPDDSSKPYFSYSAVKGVVESHYKKKRH